VPYYETVVVIDPLAEEGVADKHLGKVRELIGSKGGNVLKVEEWGKRRLAYSIKHRREGTYYLVEFEGQGETVAALDQYYRIQESILRYLTIAREAPSPEGSVSPVAMDQGHVEAAGAGVAELEEHARVEPGEEYEDQETDRINGTLDPMDA